MLKKEPSIWKIVIWIMVSIISLLVVLLVVPWQQTVSGFGIVTTLSPSERVQGISAPIGGRLGKWYVFEGDHVKKGDLIVEVRDLDPEVLTRLKDEKEAIELGISSVKIAIENASKNMKRHKYLVTKGASTARVYEQAQLERVKYTQDFAAANVELAKVRVQIARQQSRFVRSPADGVIVDRMHGMGGLIVKNSDTLATLVPDSTSRIAQLWFSSIDVPLINKGDKVMLQFEGWPAVQFSGWPAIAIGSFEGEVIFVSPQTNNQGQFKVFVKQSGDMGWPSSKILRLGTNVHAWVMLGSVSMGYEFWRRYNGFPINLNSDHLHINYASSIVDQ